MREIVTICTGLSGSSLDLSSKVAVDDDLFTCKCPGLCMINHMVTLVRDNLVECRVWTLHFPIGLSLKPSSDMQLTRYASVYLTVKWGQ